MGVYRLYSGDDGQSHIQELSEDAIKEIDAIYVDADGFHRVQWICTAREWI